MIDPHTVLQIYVLGVLGMLALCAVLIGLEGDMPSNPFWGSIVASLLWPFFLPLLIGLVLRGWLK